MEPPNENHFMLCEHCTLFSPEKITRAGNYFRDIKEESSAQSLHDFFNNLLNQNVIVLAKVYSSLQTQNKEKLAKFLRDNNFDEEKLNDLIELKGDHESKDETALVRKLFKGASQSYGDACRYNGRYRPEDIDMESMCAASKRLSMSRSRSPTINEINQKTEEAATVIEDTQPTPVTLDVKKQNGQHELNQPEENTNTIESSIQNDADDEKSFTPKSPRKKALRKSKANTDIKTTEDTTTTVVTIREKSQRRKSNPPEVKLVESVEMPSKRKRHSLPNSKPEQLETPTKKLKTGETSKNSPQGLLLNRIDYETNLDSIHEEAESLPNRNADAGGVENIEYAVGNFVEAMDSKTNMWYMAKIIELKQNEKSVRIHFHGWNARFDRDIKMNSNELRPLSNLEKDKIKNTAKRGRRSSGNPAIQKQKAEDKNSNNDEINESVMHTPPKTIIGILNKNGVEENRRINHSDSDEKSSKADDAEYSIRSSNINGSN